jgi:eukaryotic-like serine/threonine-protein kinase
VRHGETLRIPRDRVIPELADLVDQMMAADPAHRPTIANVHATLMGIRTGTPDLPARPAVPATSSALRGKGLRAARPVDPTDAEPAPRGRLVGKLISKITDRTRG